MSNETDISPDLMEAAWRTSSYSGGQGNCVEVADSLSHGVWLRDSKRPAGPVIRISRTAWSTFITHLR
ncbi:DUF397 domain-containing protein [Streptomyces sp. NPDC007875]|uniref:DUF397 domain-containing protein n=1 Tax=Streptomyces sp. NPDC007875 TaxID=3364783 RepID=UPI0036AFDE80